MSTKKDNHGCGVRGHNTPVIMQTIFNPERKANREHYNYRSHMDFAVRTMGDHRTMNAMRSLAINYGETAI